MRTARTYIAGLGTTSVLVSGVILLLLVGSALVAFNGWPGLDGGSEEIERVVVGPDAPQARAPIGPRSRSDDSKLTRKAAARAVARREREAKGPGGLDTARPVPIPRSPSTPRPGSPQGSPGGGGQPSAGSTAAPTPAPSSPQQRASSGLGNLTSALADTTQGVTDGLGGTVGQVSPVLGRTVTDTGQTIAGLLRAFGAAR